MREHDHILKVTRSICFDKLALSHDRGQSLLALPIYEQIKNVSYNPCDSI